MALLWFLSNFLQKLAKHVFISPANPLAMGLYIVYQSISTFFVHNLSLSTLKMLTALTLPFSIVSSAGRTPLFLLLFVQLLVSIATPLILTFLSKPPPQYFGPCASPGKVWFMKYLYKRTDCGQTMEKSWNSLVNYQKVIPCAANKHNNLYQNPLKGNVIILQSISLWNTLYLDLKISSLPNIFQTYYVCLLSLYVLQNAAIQ